MWRTTIVAALAAASLLTACGSDGPERSTAPRSDAPPPAPAPSGPPVTADDDPCPTPGRRPRKDLGGCVYQDADRVLGRDRTLRLSGVTVRIRDVRLVGAVVVAGAERRPPAGSSFLVVRMFIENRRRTRMALERGDVPLAVLSGQGMPKVWTTPAADGGLGPERSELRFAPGAAGNVVAVYTFEDSLRSIFPGHVRVALYLPDPPGTPKHGPEPDPPFDFRLGVFRLSR